jgi:type I restriction enzyme, S subunit
MWKETEVGRIPSDWNVLSFDKVLRIKGRIGWKGYKTSDLRNDGPVVIGGSNIKSRIHLDFSETTHLSREKFDESPEIVVKQGDVLLVTRGNGIGDVGYFNGEYKEATINPSLVILSEFKGDSRFLFYYLNSTQGNQQLLSIESGSSIPALYQGYIKTLLLINPPLQEQTAIADALSSLDDKIDLLHRQNKTLEQLAETLFRQWFVEEAEVSWEEITLSEIAEHLKENVNPFKNPDKLYKHYSIPSFDEGKEPIVELGKEILSNKYKVVSNSILVSKLNPRTPRIWMLCGNIVEDNCICSTEFQVVKPKDHNWFGFIYCFLKSNRVTKELTGASSGTSGSHQRVNPQDIFNLTLLKPSEDLIKKFDNISKEYWEKLSNNQNQLRTLTQLRDMLLPKLMSGEVRVKLVS